MARSTEIPSHGFGENIKRVAIDSRTRVVIGAVIGLGAILSTPSTGQSHTQAENEFPATSPQRISTAIVDLEVFANSGSDPIQFSDGTSFNIQRVKEDARILLYEAKRPALIQQRESQVNQALYPDVIKRTVIGILGIVIAMSGLLGFRRRIPEPPLQEPLEISSS